MAARSTKQPAIKALVFDFGGVLLDWVPEALYRRRIPDPEARRRFLTEVVTFAWHAQHDRGRPFAETSAALIARYPEHADDIRAWGQSFEQTIPCAVPGMEDLIADLAQADVPLFAISNFSAEFFPQVAARWPTMFAAFQDIVLSGAVGLVKPDSAIFRLALARFGLGPEEALFIDDLPENVRAAEREGLLGHVFKDASGLRATLAAARLLPEYGQNAGCTPGGDAPSHRG